MTLKFEDHNTGEFKYANPEQSPESRIEELESQNAELMLEAVNNQMRFDELEAAQASLLLELTTGGV
ncbi:hypothetical protein D3C72_1355190 [compost metagenome]